MPVTECVNSHGSAMPKVSTVCQEPRGWLKCWLSRTFKGGGGDKFRIESQRLHKSLGGKKKQHSYLFHRRILCPVLELGIIPSGCVVMVTKSHLQEVAELEITWASS